MNSAVEAVSGVYLWFLRIYNMLIRVSDDIRQA